MAVEEVVTVPMNRPAATLVLFSYDERPWLNCVRSLVATKAVWPDLAIWDTSKDALITRTRSREATRFLEQGHGEVLVMIDQDMGWQAGDLEHLVAMCLDRKGIVGGVYAKRAFAGGIASRLPAGLTAVVGSDAILEVEYVATGFMAIHRTVLEAMAPTLPLTIHGFRPFFEIRNEVRENGEVEGLSEDWDFCRKALDLGFSVWMDLKPRLTHMGTHAFRIEDTSWAPPYTGSATVTLRGVDAESMVTVNDCFGGRMDLYLDGDDMVITNTLLRGGTHDPEVMVALRDEVRLGDIVFELGANVGYHSMQIFDLQPARLVTVEPMPLAFGLLTKNHGLKGEREDVTRWCLVNAAVVGDPSAETLQMQRDYRNPGSSHIAPQGGISVAATTLAKLEEEYGQPDVIKVDIEGAEGLAFGTPEARRILSKTRFIVLEYCDEALQRTSGMTGPEYIALLEACGFVREFDLRDLPVGAGYCNIGMRNANAT